MNTAAVPQVILMTHHTNVCPLFQIIERLRRELLLEHFTEDSWQFRDPQPRAVLLQKLD